MHWRWYSNWSPGLLATLVLQLALLPANAQARYPERPIQMIVSYAAGGTSDLVGRIVARELSERLGQSVVVGNRVGAAGVIGVAQALRAPPDGYSMAVSGVSPTMLQQLVGRKLPYDHIGLVYCLVFVFCSVFLFLLGF